MAPTSVPWLPLSLALVACESADASDTPDASADEVALADVPNDVDVAAPPSHRLGLNDLTVLLPMPTPTTPSLVTPAAAIPDDLWQRLVVDPGDVFTDFASLHVVAVRFDLCDRTGTGTCAVQAPDADGRLRLVIQPVFEGGDGALQFGDTAVHAFYPIPAAELASVVAELRRLAALQDAPASPLQVNEALADPTGAYAQGLQALVARHAHADRLLRLTLFSQLSISAALHWVFRGEERATPSVPFAPMTIPDIDAPTQTVLLLGDANYQVTPTVDAPAGLALALSASAFAAAAPDARRAALEVLARIDDPRAHTPHTVQCVSCHVATTLLPIRAGDAGVDLASLGGYRSDDAALDLDPPGDPAARGRTLRALGYIGDVPLVSARAVNETAVVLGEIEARFPIAE